MRKGEGSSTKETIDHGDDFHRHAEIFKPDHVYLELTGERFTFHATRDHTVIAIPYELWERLRRADVARHRPDPFPAQGEPFRPLVLTSRPPRL